MNEKKLNILATVIVILLILAVVAFYLYDVMVVKTPYTKNLYRTIILVAFLLLSLFRRFRSFGRTSLEIYEKQYKEELGFAFSHKPMLRTKLLCACRLYNESNYRKALKYLYDLLKEAEFERDAVPVLLFIALCYTDVGVYEEAAGAYYELLKLDHNHAQANNNLGMVLARMGEYKSAVKHYDRSIELKPDNYSAYSNRANCYFRMLNYDMAIQDAEKALEIKNNGVEAATLLTVIYALRNEEDKKKHYYHIAITAGRKPEELNEAIEYFLNENNIPGNDEDEEE